MSSSSPENVEVPRAVKPPRKKPSKQAAKGNNNNNNKQQQQRDREFGQHKTHILSHLNVSACDLSPKGTVDVKCHAIMDILNTHEDYVTTSSCSGRIALFHSWSGDCTSDPVGADAKKMKRGASEALGWVIVKHGVLLPRQMHLVVRYLCGEAENEVDRAIDAEKMTYWESRISLDTPEDREAYSGELEGTIVVAQEDAAETATLPAVPTVGTISLKMEPFVMHVECRTMDSAKELLNAAVSDSGYRNSGVVPPGRKIMCGIRCAAGLGMEVPLVIDGVNHVEGRRTYVWSLLEMANDKMHANEKKSKLLATSVARRLASRSEASQIKK